MKALHIAASVFLAALALGPGVAAGAAGLHVNRADIHFGTTTIRGWASVFPVAKNINDATVAIAMALLAFLLPVGRDQRLLEWPEFKRIPWDVLILFGGGFALAETIVADAAPGALAEIKNSLNRHAATDWSEVDASLARLPADEWKEGLSAFTERRRPDYQSFWNES